ncbi:flagellar motility protein MotE (MotC chaperone) [Melghiribacillus thermohalophilus]|uniref:Flagellar motility protein MotE (MotC chaperone) n=1 Tax=Melghiribacillus thermohalophilus TaxID=1324956 RepID=A0A4R3NCY9_9BACI|nr:MotE family protein [Melghiribacillus thermohalophilus]TCT26770.1 flagellar motility protein MotE (MotC chaperone) [Melghiribacillus thermohalophilus]
MSSEQIQKHKKEGGKLQWFFFVIVIPLLFAITLALIVLTIAGYNVFQISEHIGSKIPVVSNFVGNDEEVLQEENTNLLATIEDQKEQIETLQLDIESKDEEIQELNEQIQQLQNQLEQNEQSQQERDELISNVTESFSQIKAEQAAQIIENLTDESALLILEKLPAEQRGAVLAAMDPEKAAELTQNFINPGE